jgi:type I restriction enzyme, S subunit
VIPSRWPQRVVRDLVTSGVLFISDGFRAKSVQLGALGVPFVRGGDIGDGWVDTHVTDHVLPEFSEQIAVKLTQPGDVAFITKGTVGRTGRLRPSQPPVVFAPQVCYWRSLDLNELDSTYLFYLLRSWWFQAQLDGVKTSGSMVADYVSISDQQHFTLPVPPIGAQRRIAAVLGALDDKIELNRKMNRTLEEMAQALFKSWFIDFDGHDDLVDSEIGPVPRAWEVRPLDAIADFLNGAACQKYPAIDGEPWLPVVKIRELNQGVTTETDRATSTIPTKWHVNDGDVLFSWSGSLVVKVWTGGPGALNQHLFKVTSQEYPRWFFLSWVKHHLSEFQRIAAGKATTMGHIQRHHLTDAKCAVPPDDVLARVGALLEPVVNRQVANELESRTLAELRNTLLPKLISGELRVPEAEEMAGVRG